MQNFTNEAIDLDNLPQYEHITLSKLDKKYWNIILINICIFFIITGTGLFLFVNFNPDLKAYLLPIGIAFTLLIVLTFMLYRLSFNKRGFALREKDVIYKSGVIAETTTIIPLNRIQHVALKEGLLARFYNLAVLEVQTAGGSAGHIQIAGIPMEKAKIIKEALVKKMDFLSTIITED